MTIWDFADKHPFAFVVAIMFVSWGIAAAVNGITIGARK